MTINEVCQLFQQGRISPFPIPILKNPQFAEFTQLSKIARQYIHGECHFWSLTLLRRQPELQLYFVYDHKRLIHSFVVAPNTQLAWDANGILSLEQITAYWQELLGRKVRITPGKKELLAQLIEPSDDEFRLTEEHITAWLAWLCPKSIH